MQIFSSNEVKNIYNKQKIKTYLSVKKRFVKSSALGEFFLTKSLPCTQSQPEMI